MNNKVKRNLIEAGIFGMLMLGIYFAGAHTEIIEFAQKGAIAAGVLNASVEQIEENHEVAIEAPTKADFGLNLVNSKGEKVNMEKFRGKVVFINLWATWCPPCIAEMPSINAMYNNIDKDKVEVLMVSLDRQFDKAIQYKNKEKFDFEVYALDGSMPPMYNTRSIPSTYVIDSKGDLVFTHRGMADYDRQDFKDYLKSL